MQLSLVFYTLIIAHSIRSVDLATPYNIKTIDFLQPFLELSPKLSEKFFVSFFESNLNVVIKTKGSFSKMIEEVVKLRPEDFKTKSLKDSSRKSLVEAVEKVLESHKLKLGENVLAANAALRDVVRDYYIIEMLQKSHVKPKPFDLSIIGEAIDLVESRDQFAFKNAKKDRASIIDHINSVVKFTNDPTVERIGTWLEYKAMPSTSIESVLTELITAINANPHKLDNIEADEATETIVQLLKTLTRIHDSDLNDKFHFVHKFGEMVKVDLTEKTFLQSFRAKIIRRVFILFVNANQVSSWKLGKQLMIKILLPTSFGRATRQYRQFLLNKYTLEGMKTELVNQVYPLTIKLYHLDLLRTFVDSELEIFEAEDLRFLFTNFLQLADLYSLPHIEYFATLRRLLLKSGDDLEVFYSLFNTLYDTMLHAVQSYQADISKPIEHTRFPATLFDRYLDSSLNAPGFLLSIFSSKQPDPKYFAVDMKNRYFFCKFFNLVNNLEEFADSEIHFLKFEYSNDVLIHKYTLKTENKTLIDFLRNSFANSTFNYKVFSDKKISGKVISEYLTQQKNLEDMEAKIVFE
jgi:hypothetical protein